MTIEYQAIVERNSIKEGHWSLVHAIKDIADCFVVFASAGFKSVFQSYEEQNPMNRKVLGLIEQNQGKLLAYHYIEKGLIFTARFDNPMALGDFRQKLLNSRYTPLDERVQERRVA